MTDLSHEMRTFQGLMEDEAKRRGDAATTALEDRDMETFQRLMDERSKAVAPRDTETRMVIHSSELGEPGLSDSLVRARVAIADTPDERKAAFNQVFPLGEMRSVRDETGANFEVFRRDPGEPWRKFDPPPTEKTEIVQDVADFASAALPVVGEAIATRGGGGLIRRTLQTAGGAAGGELAEEGVEAALGQQRQTAGEVTAQVGAEGLTGGLGGLVSEPLASILNVRRGAGALQLKPGAREAIEAQESLGLPELLPFQVAEDPIVQTMGTQAQALTTTMTDFIVKQQVGAVERLRVLQESGADPANLPRFLRARVQAAQNELDRIVSRPNVELEAGGEALQKGLVEYDTLARAEVNTMFKAARDIEDPQFDLASLDQVAKDMQEGFIVRGDTARPTAPLAGELQKVLGEIRALAENPQPIVIPRPDGSEMVISVTDQLRALRERVWDLKTVDRGQIARRPEADAGFLYGRITETLNSPQNADPNFTRAWNEASAAAGARFDTWDKAVIRATAKNEEPANLAFSYARPREVTNLRILRDTIPAENWRTFQAATKQQFLSDLPNLTRTLESFDEPTLNMLLSFQEQQAMRLVGRNFDNLAQVRDLAQMERFQDISARVIQAGDGQTVESLTRAIAPGSPEGKALSAGIINTVVDNVVRMERGVPSIDRNTLSSTLRRMDQNGSSRFLSGAERQTLQNMDRYLDMITGVPDVGTSLLRASIAKKLRDFDVRAAFDIIQAYGVGRLMTTDAGRKFLMGTGREKMNFNNLRLLGAAGATIAADEQALGRTEDTR
jgi:hypothetical protein